MPEAVYQQAVGAVELQVNHWHSMASNGILLHTMALYGIVRHVHILHSTMYVVNGVPAGTRHLSLALHVNNPFNSGLLLRLITYQTYRKSHIYSVYIASLMNIILVSMVAIRIAFTIYCLNMITIMQFVNLSICFV